MAPRARVALVRPTVARVVLSGAIVAACALGGRLALARLVPESLVLPGVRVAGEEVPRVARMDELRAWIEVRAEARGARHVVLVASDDPRRVLAEGTLADFGAHVDVDATAAGVVRVADGDDDVIARYERAKRAREHGVDVPFVLTIDDATARERLSRVKREEDAPPVPARLDLDRHDVIPEREGRYVDVEGAIANVLAASAIDAPESDVVLVPIAQVPPRFTRTSLAGLDVRAVVASYDTYFSRHGDQARRGQNIDVAAAHLDGLVLEPNELFSFNGAVGDRSEANGFQRSWEISKGEMVEGVGGGTCQVASTFHAAAFFGGLDVVERLPHSRPSAYIPMGLDATVVYPDVDLKVRNPFPFPIAIHAKVDGNHLRVELLGLKRPAHVEFRREIVESLPFERKVEEDVRLRGNVVRVKQHGIDGFRIKRTRVLSFASGRAAKIEETNDRYPPTMEIDEVPPGFDVTQLPPLASDGDADGGTAGAADAPTPSTDLKFVEGPGAHTPTAAQAAPAKLVTLRR